MQHMNSAISKGMGRGTSLLFYDVTNFYFEIGDPDPDIEDEDGYIISKRLKKSTQENREWAIDQTGYTVVDKNFKYKSRIITISVKDQERKQRQLKQKSVVYWSRHFYDRDVAEHQSIISGFYKEIKRESRIFPCNESTGWSIEKIYFKGCRE